MLCCQKSLLFLFICGWVFNKFGKMQCEGKSKIKQTNFEKLSHASRGLATIIYRFYRTIFTVPDMRSQWGFQQFYPERVIQFSRPDGRSYWTLRRRDWIFPEYLLGSLHFAARQKSRVQWSLLIRTVPALRCKIEILRAKGTFGVHFVARSESRVQII